MLEPVWLPPVDGFCSMLVATAIQFFERPPPAPPPPPPPLAPPPPPRMDCFRALRASEYAYDVRMGLGGDPGLSFADCSWQDLTNLNLPQA